MNVLIILNKQKQISWERLIDTWGKEKNQSFEVQPKKHRKQKRKKKLNGPISINNRIHDTCDTVDIYKLITRNQTLKTCLPLNTQAGTQRSKFNSFKKY